MSEQLHHIALLVHAELRRDPTWPMGPVLLKCIEDKLRALDGAKERESG